MVSEIGRVHFGQFVAMVHDEFHRSPADARLELLEDVVLEAEPSVMPRPWRCTSPR